MCKSTYKPCRCKSTQLFLYQPVCLYQHVEKWERKAEFHKHGGFTHGDPADGFAKPEHHPRPGQPAPVAGRGWKQWCQQTVLRWQWEALTTHSPPTRSAGAEETAPSSRCVFQTHLSLLSKAMGPPRRGASHSAHSGFCSV